jgi:hypothetical protein
LLVDFPSIDGQSITKEQQARLGAYATIQEYDAFQIKNWSTRKVGSNVVLSMVSLSECVDVLGDDGLTVTKEDQERRLILDDDGYRVEIYLAGEMIDMYEPRNSKGLRLNYIPFYFMGSEYNDVKVDKIPIFPIADLNIGHYRNSADYEASIIYQNPQPYATGLTSNWVDQHLEGFQMGSGSMLPLPEGSSFGYAQPAQNQPALEGMREKQQAMVQLGAKLVNPNVSFKTASEAIIANSSENSRLQTIIDNVESAYQMALEALADFMGTDSPIFSIDTDLSAATSDPQMISVLKDIFAMGAIGQTDLRDYMRKVRVLDRTDEDIDSDIETSLVGFSESVNE